MIYDLIGIGGGPSHLSLAALFEKLQNVHCLFFERELKFKWHSGMMIKGAQLQVSFLKDLVTLVDPTNEYSFLNYLQNNQRLYQFIIANFKQITRQEFHDYLQWVSNQLKTLYRGKKVCDVQYKKGLFKLHLQNGDILDSRHISIGVGQKPHIPDFAAKLIGPHVFHSSRYMCESADYIDKDVLVLGSGQSGAEIFSSLIGNEHCLPDKVYWVTQSMNFTPLDDSPFTNEWFTPKYSQFFYELSLEKRMELLSAQRYASDGISIDRLQKIFQQLYELNYLSKEKIKVKLKPNCSAISIESKGNRYQVNIQNKLLNRVEQLMVDKIILATGYKFIEPECIASIVHRFRRENEHLKIKKDYSVSWDGDESNKIFMLNGAKLTHGIADPNLSLIAYRSAAIINSVLGYDCYKNINGHAFVNWHDTQEKAIEFST